MPANSGSSLPSAVSSTGSRPTSARSIGVHARAERRGQQLHAEADAEERAPGLDRLADQPLLGAEPGMLGVVAGAHRPAHRQHRVELAPVGQRLALVELDRDRLDPALAHHLREDARVLAGDVLEDEDAHRLGSGRPGRRSSRLASSRPSPRSWPLHLDHLAAGGVDLDHGERREESAVAVASGSRARRSRTAAGRCPGAAGGPGCRSGSKSTCSFAVATASSWVTWTSECWQLRATKNGEHEQGDEHRDPRPGRRPPRRARLEAAQPASPAGGLTGRCLSCCSERWDGTRSRCRCRAR